VTQVGVPSLDLGSAVLMFPQRGSHAFLPCADLRHPRLVEESGGEPGIWLARAKSGAALIIPAGVEVRRNGQGVVKIVVLHHGEKIDFAGRTVSFAEVEKLRLDAGNRRVGWRCPQCHRSFKEGDEVLQCPFCEELYCTDCWEFLTGKRCFSRNCNFVPVPVGSPS
jgi:hypothetical protein